MYHLIDGEKRCNELRRILPAITQRMLTLQLRELGQDGLVHRQVPPREEYSLTEFGRTLVPIIRMMKKWGATYRNDTQTPSAAHENSDCAETEDQRQA